MTFLERSLEAKNPTGKKLLQLMHNKQTNLCVSVDVTSTDKLLSVVDMIGPEVCVVKTHIDILNDFSDDTVTQLLQLAKEHHFLLFEDRKFADIGNTVQLQYEQGLYHIVEWADMVTAHAVPGPGILDALRQSALQKGRGVLLLAEMSSAGTLATGAYATTVLQWAREYQDIVMGVIGKSRNELPAGQVVMTPGVNLSSKGDTLGQQYVTPEAVVAAGSDVIIVGRGIIGAPDPRVAAQEYRAAGWQALQHRMA